ncbi:tyrosine-type recombinase/integrase [Knoellia sp. GCM10027209]
MTQLCSPLFPDVAGSLMRRTVAAINAGHDKPVLPPMRLHDLRHVHATLLLKAGVPVHVVAARLGHADPAITLRVYAHVLRDQAVEVAQIFGAVVDSDQLVLANPLANRPDEKPAAEGPSR